MIIFLKIPPLIDISEERDKLAPKFNPEHYFFFSQINNEILEKRGGKGLQEQD